MTSSNVPVQRALTQQQAFNEVVRGLSYQQWMQCHHPDDADQCLYRGPDKLRCAAGHLILDRDYRPDMEGYPIRHIIESQPNALPMITDPTFPAHRYALISELQEAHDESDSPASMYRMVRAVGTKYKLLWPSEVPPPSSVLEQES